MLTNCLAACADLGITVSEIQRDICEKIGLTENDGHENDGPSKLQDMKLQDMKKTDQIAGHENAGHENDGPSSMA